METGYLEQQLVFCDSLDWFDEEVTDGQPGLDVLLDSLKSKHQHDPDVLSLVTTYQIRQRDFKDLG